MIKFLSFAIELDKIHLHSQSVRYTNIGGKARSFPVKEYTQFKKEVAEKVKEKITSEIDLDSACSIKLGFCYKIPKSYNKSKSEALQGKYKVSSPDVDNICKSILDSFTGVLYNDDKQIVHLTAHKCYGELNQEANIIVICNIEYM